MLQDMILYKLFKLTPDFMCDLWVPDQAQLTKQFRKIMVKIHPDKNPNESAQANYMTAIVNCCYLILKDENLAAQYFEYGHETLEMPYTWFEIEECYNYVEEKLKTYNSPPPPPPPSSPPPSPPQTKEATPPPKTMEPEEEVIIIITEDEEEEEPESTNDRTTTPRRGSLEHRQAEAFLNIADRRGKLKFLTKWNTLVTSWEPLEIAKEQDIFKSFCQGYCKKHARKFNNLCKKYPDLGSMFD